MERLVNKGSRNGREKNKQEGDGGTRKTDHQGGVDVSASFFFFIRRRLAPSPTAMSRSEAPAACRRFGRRGNPGGVSVRAEGGRQV